MIVDTRDDPDDDDSNSKPLIHDPEMEETTIEILREY